MGLPSPESVVSTNVCCSMSIPTLSLPELMLPPTNLPSIDRPGILNLNLSFAKPIIGWFEKVLALLPPPTDPDKFQEFVDKIISLASQLTLPTMQLETLNSIKFPPMMSIPDGLGGWIQVPVVNSMQYLLNIKLMPIDPNIKINMALRYPGYSFQPPNLYDISFAQFTSKFNIFLDKIIGPLKKIPPKMPSIPGIDDLYNTIINSFPTVNPNINLPQIPTWQLLSPDYKDKIPAIGVFRTSYCQATFFKNLVVSLVGG